MYNSCSALLCAAQFQHNLGILQYVLSQVQPFRTFAASQLTLLLDCWFLRRAPYCRIPRTANTQIQQVQIPSIITFKTSHTACLWASTAGIHRCGQACRQKLLASTSYSIRHHPLKGFVPSTVLQIEQLLQCSPCSGWNDKAFSRLPSLGNCLQPCTVLYHAAHQHKNQVQLLSCISLRRLLEMPEAVPESSNSLVLHAPSSLSSLLALQSQSDLWIDAV